MSSYSRIRGAFVSLACLGAACAPEVGFSTTLALVPQSEVAELPTDCASALGADDADLSWARAEDDDDAIVIDSPQGSCVQYRDAVTMTLKAQKRDRLAALIARDFVSGDPSPHPEISSHMADPSPHPDKPQDTTADASPDDGDDNHPVVIVFKVVIGAPATGGDGTVPPPPPGPTKPE